MNPFRIWSGEWFLPHHSINLVHPAGFTNKNHGCFTVPPKKNATKEKMGTKKRAKQSWQLRVGTEKRFSFADSTHKSHGILSYVAALESYARTSPTHESHSIKCFFPEMGNLRTSILSFFPSNPSDILPIFFLEKCLCFSKTLASLCELNKKNAHNYNQMYSKYSKLTDIQLVQILHSCIRTHRTHLCSPDLRSDPTCLSHEGWVGWLALTCFFCFGVSLKGRANLVLPKGWWGFCLADLRDQFKEDMCFVQFQISLALSEGCRGI